MTNHSEHDNDRTCHISQPKKNSYSSIDNNPRSMEKLPSLNDLNWH